MPLILASASASRRAMLEAAGLAFETAPARLDEAAVKARHRGSARSLAAALARAKAAEVSRRFPDALVIGSDSLVTCGDRTFDKPRDREQAAIHLRSFSARPMRLLSAVALASDGRVEWSHAAAATLDVRPLSEAFIADYLGEEWPAVAGCVGVFRIEGRGVQLFERIRGDHFTILGMPLLPLLTALRSRGALPS